MKIFDKYRIRQWRIRFKYWLVNRIALPIIRRAEKDSSLIRHYENEGGKLSEVKDLLALFGTQGHSGYSAPYIIRGFYDAARFKVLSPLKFTDDEFSDKLGFSDDTRQNRRMSSVFKYPDGVIKDIDAVTWFEETGVRYDMKDECFVGDEYASKGYGFHCGVVVMFNDVDHDKTDGQCDDRDMWHIFDCEIGNRDTFMGKNQVRVPALELYDSGDEHNDFFCYFARTSDIPTNFFDDYSIMWNSERDEQFRDCIEYCKKHVDELTECLRRKGWICKN